jgi:hypothetical protein
MNKFIGCRVQGIALKIIVAFLLFSISYHLLPITSVFGHILETNGSIGAVIHIAPEDDPVAGELSSFFFEFKDKEGKFKPENCDCTVSITQAGREIYSQPLFKNSTNPSLDNVSLTYTFPQKDVYEIKIIGKPISSDSFKPFTLTYTVRIDKESESKLSSPETITLTNWFSEHLILLLGAVIIGILFILAIIKQISRSNKLK